MANLPTEPSASKRDERNARLAPGADDHASMDDVVGEDLPRQLGRYMLLKRIARGGMGEVLLASTMGIEGAERPVIVKIIRREHKKDPNFHARFLDETRVQAQLAHSGVAQVIDAAIDERTGEPYAVVEHVEGRSLGELRQRAVQTGHRLSWADSVALACLIAEGLSHVHERKDAAGRPLAIVHRDLSPQNVMVGFTGEAKIIDFGTARGQNRRCHTVAGVVFAKPGYVAPEVANGDSGDARVDLYALGIMLWELCKGSRFLQGDAQQHLAKVARNELSPPRLAEMIGAPAQLDDVIAKLTAFERDARYLAARAAATDLAKLLGPAPALPSGERGVRQRAAHLLSTLFPGEPLASRKEFARLVAASRAPRPAARPSPEPRLAPAQTPVGAPAPRQAPPAPANKSALAATMAAPAKKSAPEPIKPAAKAQVEQPKNSLEGSRYRAVREIGRGESSVVFEAEHEVSKKRAAIKVLAGAQANEPAAVERFRRGARALSLIEHENLVRVIDAGTLADGRPFCAMDLYEGETLKEYLAREKGADYREALGMASKILAALEVAHAAGVVHRDIQPANVLLPSDGGLRVLDFGLAAGSAIALDPAPNGPGGDIVIHGTPEYMAPEQITGAEVDGRADLYAVGCVAFELLTGRLPFEGPSAVAILDLKRKGSPVKPAEIAPTRVIPEAVSEVILKALARHPSARFQSATEMRKAIERALSAASRGHRSRRWIGALAAAMAVIAIAGGAAMAKREALAARLPPRIAAVFMRHAPAPAQPAPAPAPEPARTTDLAKVPLGEVPLSAPPAANPAAPGGGEVAAGEDPALDDPAEHDDVLAADLVPSSGDAAAATDAPAQAEAPAADAPKPAPARPAHVRHGVRRSSPRLPAKPAAPGPHGASRSHADSHHADSHASDAAHGASHEPPQNAHKPSDAPAARSAKDMAPPKDGEESARRKKKKVRLARAQ